MYFQWRNSLCREDNGRFSRYKNKSWITFYTKEVEEAEILRWCCGVVAADLSEYKIQTGESKQDNLTGESKQDNPNRRIQTGESKQENPDNPDKEINTIQGS